MRNVNTEKWFLLQCKFYASVEFWLVGLLCNFYKNSSSILQMYWTELNWDFLKQYLAESGKHRDFVTLHDRKEKE